MNLRGLIFLGWRYVSRNRGRAALLVAVFALSLALPSAIYLGVREANRTLLARAGSTPLILGAAGSPLELVFNALYFSKPDIAQLSRADLDTIRESGFARVIPLHVHFQARGFRIAGTSLDYFRHHGLETADGRLMTRLGDCVLGHEVARELGLRTGDSIVSTPSQLFDLAGVYPLKMRITGVLAPSGSADDRAVFCDVKTAWVIAGISHGHEDAAGSERVLERTDQHVTMNASVREYQEITDENIDSFHVHGTPDELPLTSAIVIPFDQRSETILLGRYLERDDGLQLIRPSAVMKELFDTVFRVRNLVLAALLLIGAAAAAIAILVFSLSNRLRHQEFVHLRDLGASPGSVRFLLAFEAGFTLLSAALLAGLLIAASVAALPFLTRTWLS